MTRYFIKLVLSKSFLYYYNSNLSLLSTLEKQRIAVEFQCRSGYCGACRLRLLAGQINYQQKPIAFLRKGEILPCCCVPLDDIELEL